MSPRLCSVYSFGWEGGFVPLKNFSLIYRRQRYQYQLTFARYLHVWPLSSKGSLECHTYCDTGHPFIMVIFEDPWHSHQWRAVTTCFYYLGLSRLGFEHPTFRLQDERSNPLRHCCGQFITDFQELYYRYKIDEI